jgi:hypothetical protein
MPKDLSQLPETPTGLDVTSGPAGQPLGLIAEFATPEDAVECAQRLRSHGFTDLDAYGPFPSPELAEAIGFHEHRIAPCVLAGGTVGVIAGFGLQYYATVTDYPHNIGGRPVFSWPAFIPVTFETAVLFAAITGLVSLLVLNRLPRLSHPVFAAKNFRRATTDHFFVAVSAAAPGFSFDEARRVLNLGDAPLSISVLRQENQS